MGKTIHGKGKDKNDNRKEYLKIAKENFEWKCMKCQTIDNGKQDLLVHHIDGDNRNNNKHNLMVLCNPCHFHIHHPFKQYNCVVCDTKFKAQKTTAQYCSDKCNALALRVRKSLGIQNEDIKNRIQDYLKLDKRGKYPHKPNQGFYGMKHSKETKIKISKTLRKKT